MIEDWLRRLLAVGITLFFAALLFLLVTFIARNPQVIQSVVSGIGDMLRNVFSLTSG